MSVISAELAAALVSSMAALISVVSTFLFKRQMDREQQAVIQRNKLDLYQHPLLLAAVALYWKLEHILNKGFTVYLFSQSSTEAQKRYVFQHTAYVIASFLSWVRIIKRQVLFMRIAERDSESALMWDHVEEIIHAFSSDAPEVGHHSFLIWRGTQEAIGEEMIIHSPIDDMPRCAGYSTFCSLIKEKPFLKELVEDTEKMLRSQTSHLRLTTISERLIPLAEHLDPKQVYFKRIAVLENRTVRPAESRTSTFT